jgi:hypothetical protein
MKILLLPGLGDIHWVLLKLQSWLKRRNIRTKPIVSLWDIDNRPRSIEYLDRIPWLIKGEYLREDFNKHKNIFNSLYTTTNSNDYVENFLGYDILIGTNGNMRNGVSFRSILGGADVNHDYGPVLTPEDLFFGLELLKKGPYFILCFSNYGMFADAWCNVLTADKIRAMLDLLKIKFPSHRFIFTGCSWDDAFTKQVVGNDINLTGQTALGNFLGALKYSSGYIGWCGGNSIIAQHLKVSTVVWWSNRYFPKHDRVGWERPGARHFVLDVEDFVYTTPEKVAQFLC